MTQTTRVSIERNIVLVRVETVLARVETVLVRVKMAEVLTSEYFDGENRIRSVILESELTVVVRAKVCLPPGSLFSKAHRHDVKERRKYLLYRQGSADGRAENSAENSKEVDLSLAVQSRLERQSSKWPAIENNP